MKKVLSMVLVLCMMLAFMPAVQAQQPYELSLNGEWDFKYYADANLVPEDVTQIVFEDKIQVPGAMELQGYGYPGYYYETSGGWGQAEDDGVRSAGVYKIELDRVLGETFMLNFENVSDELTVYIDGEKLLDSKMGAMGTLCYSVPSNFKQNTIICVVKRNKSGINKADDFALSGIMGNVTATNAISISNGKRNVEVENNVLTVDGEEVVLKGVKYTATHPDAGNVLTKEQIDKDLALIKEYGFNCVWTSCAPAYFYEKAGKMGLYVIDEANVNLAYADRDVDTAKNRVEKMVKNHSYEAVIMWSVGYGDGNGQQLIDTVKKLDNRPVAQEVNFAPDFEVFGNTGGMADWVEILGDGNVGGFVDEFADKELYYTKNAYDFTVKDAVTGENVTLDGEITNYKGVDMLGKGTYTRSVDPLNSFTVLSYISNANKDRVIFETEDKSIRLETVNYRIRLTVNGQSIDADGGEGKVAAVYADGEMQLFTSRSFKSNMECDAKLQGNYTVGEGNGAVAIEYVKIYNDILTIDELIELTAEDKCISSVDFKSITVNSDKSYKFLAYGGDFGDEPNSYYKCLTGLFTSTREPHPEAEEFKAILAGDVEYLQHDFEYAVETKAEMTVTENSAVWKADGLEATVTFDGKITSYIANGTEQLLEPMCPTVLRDNTIRETEAGVMNSEGWETVKVSTEDNVLYVVLNSTVTNGRLNLAYYMTNFGLHVSMQSQFGDGALKPTFIGFNGVSGSEYVSWVGSKYSTYPDRDNSGIGEYYLPVSEMSDNYALPQENGNRFAYSYALCSENETYETISFVSEYGLECQVHDYSSQAMLNADHDENIEKEDKAYFRVGGYIAGVGDNREYKLNDNTYGFDFCITPYLNTMAESEAVYINGERYTAFATGVKTYVYQTNEPVTVTAERAEVVQDEKKAVIGDYTIYFAPDNAYLSDLEGENVTAEIAKDRDFNGNNLTMRGNDYWAPAVTYDKGIALKNGSITYDVSAFTSHTFNAVIGKADFDWRSMGGNFDRSMMQASCDVIIELDGVVVEEVKGVSMRSGSREVNIDVSGAKEMTITVKGNGSVPQYEDAVLANAAFVPDGPMLINFEKKDGKAEITVLNTDEEYVDVVLSGDDNGTVTTTATRIGKGLYRTISVNAGDNAKVQAVITGLGTVILE